MNKRFFIQTKFRDVQVEYHCHFEVLYNRARLLKIVRMVYSNKAFYDEEPEELEEL